MKATSLILAAILISPVISTQAFSAEFVKPELIAYEFSPAAKDDALYADGTRAINEGRWSDAVELFNKVVQMHGERAEGALYWRAYAENKEGQPARALSTCAELRHTYPKSEWLDECGALEIEIRGHSAQPVQPQAEQDEDLKLLALNAIMQQDEARAIAARSE